MSYKKIKDLFSKAVESVTSDISRYVIHPGKDLTRSKQLPADKLLSFMVSCDSSSTKIELLDFFGLDAYAPSSSAFSQQRAKLKPEALEAVFHNFNSSVQSMQKTSGYKFFAADGSTFTFFSKPVFSRVNVTLVRSHKRKIIVKDGFYRRFVDANASFDYLEYGSQNTYDLSFRIVRFPISETTYECIVTNLPEDEFPMEQIKLIYF